MTTKIARWGNSLAIRLPAAVVEALELKEGDDIEVILADDRTFAVRRDSGSQLALERIRALRRPLPPGFRFDRDEASAK